MTTFNTITGDDWKRSLTKARPRRIEAEAQRKEQVRKAWMNQLVAQPTTPPFLGPRQILIEAGVLIEKPKK